MRLRRPETGRPVDQPYQYVGQYGYYTHYQEPDFGLLQLGVRFYDMETGKFTQRDPLAQLMLSTPYAYSEGEPLNKIDPGGKWSCKLCSVDQVKISGKCDVYDKNTGKYITTRKFDAPPSRFDECNILGLKKGSCIDDFYCTAEAKYRSGGIIWGPETVPFTVLQYQGWKSLK